MVSAVRYRFISLLGKPQVVPMISELSELNAELMPLPRNRSGIYIEGMKHEMQTLK